jgi:intein-encoded DNA endonuclease-like protein
MQTSSKNTCTERKNDWVYEKAAQDKVVFVESISQNMEESFSAYDMSYLSNVSDGDDEKLRSFGSDR